jgi:hypothetical protein
MIGPGHWESRSEATPTDGQAAAAEPEPKSWHCMIIRHASDLPVTRVGVPVTVSAAQSLSGRIAHRQPGPGPGTRMS